MRNLQRTSFARLAGGCPTVSAFFCGDSKLRTVTDLAYAVTGHKGMGGTVSAGSAFITGREPLEWLYVAMTRGRNDNTAIAVTHDGLRNYIDWAANAYDAGAGESPVHSSLAFDLTVEGGLDSHLEIGAAQ